MSEDTMYKAVRLFYAIIQDISLQYNYTISFLIDIAIVLKLENCVMDVPVWDVIIG
jgi:hypothetical protein